MSSGKIETVQGMCVVALTKHLMQKYGLPQDQAYARLLQTEIYTLLMDIDTRLYLETNQYLCEACDRKCDDGSDALYEYINRE